MKLITLNIWGGQVYEPLMAFLKKYSAEVDVFCFQEVFNNPPGVPSKVQTKKPRLTIYLDLQKALPKFNSYIHPTQDGEESLAIFVNKNIKVEKIAEIFVYRWRNAMEGNDASTYGINVEYLQFNKDGKPYTIANLHGHWTPNFKGDNEARLKQSRNIQKFLDETKGAKILCGDYNLAPDTKSMKILEKGMRNLITENNITSTRSHYYKNETKLADYILVSKDIEVNKFEVFQDVVSDHLPLLLDFD